MFRKKEKNTNPPRPRYLPQPQHGVASPLVLRLGSFKFRLGRGTPRPPPSRLLQKRPRQAVFEGRDRLYPHIFKICTQDKVIFLLAKYPALPFWGTSTVRLSESTPHIKKTLTCYAYCKSLLMSKSISRAPEDNHTSERLARPHQNSAENPSCSKDHFLLMPHFTLMKPEWASRLPYKAKRKCAASESR